VKRIIIGLLSALYGLTYATGTIIAGVANMVATAILLRDVVGNNRVGLSVQNLASRLDISAPGNAYGPCIAIPPTTETALAGSTNNWAITSTTFHLISASGAFNVTGLQPSGGNPNGCMHIFVNTGANVITFTHEDVASSAANRMQCTAGANIALPQFGVLLAWYESTGSRWHCGKLA
jgi:hypothetical protein